MGDDSSPKKPSTPFPLRDHPFSHDPEMADMPGSRVRAMLFVLQLSEDQDEQTGEDLLDPSDTEKWAEGIYDKGGIAEVMAVESYLVRLIEYLNEKPPTYPELEIGTIDVPTEKAVSELKQRLWHLRNGMATFIATGRFEAGGADYLFLRSDIDLDEAYGKDYMEVFRAAVEVIDEYRREITSIETKADFWRKVSRKSGKQLTNAGVRYHFEEKRLHESGMTLSQLINDIESEAEQYGLKD